MSGLKIFITGGAGFVGSKLVENLLTQNNNVTVYDIMYFGHSHLPENHKNLRIIKGDIRNIELLNESVKNHDIFINLACISNDTSFELDENLSKSINYDCFEPMVLTAKKNKIKRFIHASTSSVYGISSKRDVKEDHPLVPLTLYNKFKAMVEPILLKYLDDDFSGVIIRPATVCGYSKRLRLDLSVNILTNFAVNKSFINVFGGEQLRPNLHIDDYCEVVQLLINSPKDKINKNIFNVGSQNFKIIEIAEIVRNIVLKEFSEKNQIEIIKTDSNDKRSYHINSDKIKNILGFVPRKSIEDAIKDLCLAFKKKLIFDSFNNINYFNVKKLKEIKAN